MGKSIVLTGGGTAGHVLPHFALLPHLEKHFDKIYYFGGHGGIEHALVAKENEKRKAARKKQIEYFAVTCVKLRRGVDLRNICIPFKLIKGIHEAKKLLAKIRPNAVFSKGGFVAYPTVRAAAKLGIPVVAHESDMSMGLANKMSAKNCRTICTTFARTAELYKGIHTGSPIRAEIYKGDKVVIATRHGFANGGTRNDSLGSVDFKNGGLESGGKRNLLVIGGSLGAARINEVVRAGLPELLKTYHVIHICGRGKTAENLSPNGYVQLEFADDIENYLAWADVVVSRAGSNSVCELMALKKPTLFVPLSTGRGDQLENAREILRMGAAGVCLEENFDGNALVSGLNDVWSKRAQFSKNMSLLGNLDGTEKIVDAICGVL